MNPLLKLSHVSFSYHEADGETQALSDITFSLDAGKFLAIVGPSGCGKSTLLSLICGLLAPEEGTISLSGLPFQEAKANIGYMLQRDHLFEWRTVYSNVTLGLEIQKKMTPDRLQKVDSMLETYGLSEFRSARPSQLSGGMRQRAALIRTLALEPDLLLLDEPFSATTFMKSSNGRKRPPSWSPTISQRPSAPPTRFWYSPAGPGGSAKRFPSILTWRSVPPWAPEAPRNSKAILILSGRS